jgi:drug/metabolite transporter (DMT)-like permease
LFVFAIALLAGGLFAINAIFAYQSEHIHPAFWTTVWYQLKLLPVFFAANLLIGYGLKFTYQVFGHMTLTLAFSKGIEMTVCVLIGFLFLKEVPNWRTLLGLAIIVAGFWIMKLK